VIDEIELAQQTTSGKLNATGSRYIAPYLHLLASTETTQLHRKQWVGKFKETKDMVASLEKRVMDKLHDLEKVRPARI
jgi:hypothetical protein